MEKIRRCVLLAVCIGLAIGITPVCRADRVEDAEEDIRRMLNGFVQEEPAVFAYGDYDGDGLYEAFALVGEEDSAGRLTGDLWFVSPLFCDTIQMGMRYLGADDLGADGAKLFVAAEWDDGDEAVPRGWVVDGGYPAELTGSDIEGIEEGMIPNEFYLYVPGSGTETKGMQYYFRLGGLQLQEYGAIYITEDEFRCFEGAQDILDEQAQQGRQLMSILYRSNHIIHLNYKSGTEYVSVTVRYDRNSVTYWKETQGMYDLALRPDSADFPPRFIPPTGEADVYDWEQMIAVDYAAQQAAMPPAPTETPTAVPTPAPTIKPTPAPTAVPTAEPTVAGPETYGMSYVMAHMDTEAREGAGVGFASIGPVSEGTVMKYLDLWLADRHGALWYEVSVFGQTGWVSEDCVYFISEEEAEAAQRKISDNSISRYSGSFSVEASSYFTGNINAVNSTCAMDDNLVTAWNSNNRITGEWLRISVRDGGLYEIGGLRIAPGYWKNWDVYGYNSRPKTVEVYCDNRYIQTFELNDAKDYQTMWFDEPAVGSSIKLVIADGYRGSAHKDLCITEVELLGAAGNYLASDVMDDWGTAVRKAKARVSNGGTIEKGDYGMHVIGIQLLLRDGFGVLSGNVDGSFGSGTQNAVDMLADRMRAALDECEPMYPGVVNAAYWRNMMEYMDQLR